MEKIFRSGLERDEPSTESGRLVVGSQDEPSTERASLAPAIAREMLDWCHWASRRGWELYDLYYEP